MFPRDPATRAFVRRLIRQKAERLVRLRALRFQDRDDFAQEMHMEIERRSVAFDASRGSAEAFTTTIVSRCSQNYVRNYYCRKRFAADCRSTERTCVSGARRTVHARCGTRRLTDEELQDLRLDLEQALKTLTPELRRVAELLMLHTKAEAARRIGLPRMTFMTQVATLRRRFERRGLQKYL